MATPVDEVPVKPASKPRKRRPVVFISHRFQPEDDEVAKTLEDKLRILSVRRLDVRRARETPGSKKWRAEIEKNINEAKIFILLYTRANADWTWCFFETGLFQGKKRRGHLICLKNDDIVEPPSPISDIQVFNADRKGIQSFFEQFLYDGVFTNGLRLNDGLFRKDRPMLEAAVEELSDLFDRAKITVEYFTNRLVLGPLPPPDSDTEVDAIKIRGEKGTLSVLGFRQKEINWGDLYQAYEKRGENSWLDALKNKASKIIRGDYVAADLVLPVFSNPKGTGYLPVVSRIERRNGQPEFVYLILIDAMSIEVPTMHDAGLESTPSRQRSLIMMLNMTRRVRWDILEPTKGEILGIPAPSKRALPDIGKELTRKLIGIETEAELKDFMHPEKLAAEFPPEERPEILAMFGRYAIVREELFRAVDESSAESLARALDELLRMNKQFMLIGLTTYVRMVKEMGPHLPSDEALVHELEVLDAVAGD